MLCNVFSSVLYWIAWLVLCKELWDELSTMVQNMQKQPIVQAYWSQLGVECIEPPTQARLSYGCSSIIASFKAPVDEHTDITGDHCSFVQWLTA